MRVPDRVRPAIEGVPVTITPLAGGEPD
jgi:hypothetical protein